MMDINVLKALSNADGIVSYEQEVRDILKKELSPYTDETMYDGLGSIICKKNGKGNGPKVMICAHMDEVGYMVRSITEGGLIMLMVVGGVKTDLIHYQKLRITTTTGNKISGIVAGDYNKTASSKMYVNIGAKTKEEVERLGIQVGDMVTFSTEFEKLSLPNIYAGKAMDNRLACFILTELAKSLQHELLDCDVYFTGTVGEEVGLRGAKTAAQMINPDIVFVIDVACYPDEFVRDHTNNRQLGKGPMLTHFDRTLAPNRSLIDFVRTIANTHNIPLQHDMFNNGGTDGGEVHKVHEGKPTVVTCLPCRYGHCAYSVIDITDTEKIISLYELILETIDDKLLDTILNF